MFTAFGWYYPIAIKLINQVTPKTKKLTSYLKKDKKLAFLDTPDNDMLCKPHMNMICINLEKGNHNDLMNST